MNNKRYFIELRIRGIKLEITFRNKKDLMQILYDILERDTNEIKVEDWGISYIPKEWCIQIGEKND